MRRLTIQRPDVKVGGVDINADAIARVPMLLGFFDASRIQDLKWTHKHVDAALINPGRLLEMDELEREKTREALTRVPMLFVYAYGDWCAKGDLEKLTAEAGLPIVRMVHKTPDLQVGIVQSK